MVAEKMRHSLKQLFEKSGVRARKPGEKRTDYSILRKYASLESSAHYMWGAVSQELRSILVVTFLLTMGMGERERERESLSQFSSVCA